MSGLSSFNNGPFAASSSASASSSRIHMGPRRRVIFIGIKRGRIPGVYTDQELAEEQVIDYPSACLRWFSTRYAAEAYVAGWPWKGELIPKNCPYPLREYLNMTYPNPAYRFPGPSIPQRATSPAPSPDMPAPDTGDGTLSHRASSATLRPPLGHHRNSWRNSMVKAPSPLRHQVDEQGRISVEAEKAGRPPRTPKARNPAMSLGRQGGEAVIAAVKDNGEGKVKSKRSSIFGIPTFSRKPTAPAAPAKITTAQLSPSGSGWKDLPPPPTRMELRQSRSDPNLPRRPHTSHSSSPLNDSRPRPQPSNRQSGLWAAPPPPRPAPIPSAQQPKSAPTFADTTAPTFSRAALRRSGVIMPASAPHIPSPRRSPSTPSLSPSSSTSSISSVSSTSSLNGSSSKGMTNDLVPPRAGFMRRPSSLSLSSTSSSESIATITTGQKGGMPDKDVGYGQDLIGGAYKAAKAQRVTEGDIHQKKEKEKGMMRGFGKMFGMKKRA